MTVRVNRELLATTTFDSGSLGLMAMVIHQFSAPGHYVVAVTEQGRIVTNVEFDVDEKSTNMQLDIDLAAAASKAHGRPADCDCKSEPHVPNVVSAKGYVLFYASKAGSYSATVANQDRKLIFDSTRLGNGDLFAISLLEPTRYSMKNTLGQAAGEIDVTLKPEMAKRIKTLDTAYVDVTEKEFKPSKIELTSSQGLVFRVAGTARIVVSKVDRIRPKPEKPIIRWQNHRAK